MKSHYLSHVPIYKKLYDYYRKRILDQSIVPGKKLDSITRIMSRHEVSRETAKRVIHMLQDDGLVVTKAGKGTFVNTQQELKNVWAMVVPFYSSNIEQLITVTQQEAEKYGRALHYFLHYNNAEEEMRLVGTQILEGAEAVIVVPNYDESHTADFYRNLVSGKTKLILADNTMAGSYFSYVIQSYDLGIKRVFDYFKGKEHGNILLLGNERWLGKNLVNDLIEQTFFMLLLEEQQNKKLFVERSIRKLDAKYFKENSIRAVLALQDIDAVRLIGYFKENGIKVPEDVSVVSYGNTDITQFFSPAITSVDCKYEEMATHISAMIFSKNKQNNQRVISPELIVRHT